MGTNTAKPYKIQEVNGSRRVGITAMNMQDLRKKAATRLNISEDYRLCLEDGTEVDNEEYFKRLPPQTCFTFVNSDEGNLENDLFQVKNLTQKILRRLHEGHTYNIKKVQEFLTGDDSETVNRALSDYLSTLQTRSNINLDTRDEDEAWFEGLAKKYQTKDAVMKAGAQGRIRNYYHKTKEYISEQNVNKCTQMIVETFHQVLRSNEYHGNYFVRSADKGVRICDQHGWFKCAGAYNTKVCSSKHSINPYASKEARIVFSTWNLDHVIEKSREVFPTFVKVAENCPSNCEVNWQYFYNLLFTKANLKLVHIACHIKGIHSGQKCDKNKFYKITTKLKGNRTGKAKQRQTRRSPRR